MKIVAYAGEWTANALSRLIKFSAPRCKYFVLITLDPAGAGLVKPLDELTEYLNSRTLVTAWPGTVKLDGDQHELLKFNATDASYVILIEKILPELLSAAPQIEDLSLLRADGRPFFVTITHEHEAYFEVDPAEIHELEAAIGADNLVEEADDQLPEERY